MAEQVRIGLPINLLSASQAGATSPAAIAGSLAQALAECLAECLAGLAFVNLYRPDIRACWACGRSCPICELMRCRAGVAKKRS
jgi:trimethylamine:corrinoid methyltransferase-like protein